MLGPLLLLQRRLQIETQAIFLLLTRRGEIALVLFSLLLFPGVLLHEASHYLVARLLGVRTGRFSLIPRPMPGGRLQMGFVETSSSDFVRDAIIGSAPLLAGSLFVAYTGVSRLGLQVLWDTLSLGQLAGFWPALSALPRQPDFWLWFYLTFAVSSTMMPSASDRRAWLPVAITLGVLLGIVLLAGAGPWLMSNLALPVNQALRAAALVLGFGVAVHLALWPPIWVFRRALSRLTGLKVV